MVSEREVNVKIADETIRMYYVDHVNRIRQRYNREIQTNTGVENYIPNGPNKRGCRNLEILVDGGDHVTLMESIYHY